MSDEATSVLVDARGVDHHPPAPVLHASDTVRRSRISIGLAVVAFVGALVVHWFATDVRPDDSAASLSLRSMFQWSDRSAVIEGAVDRVLRGEEGVWPTSLLFRASPPSGNPDDDRWREQAEGWRAWLDMAEAGPYRRADRVAAEWDLAMLDAMTANGIDLFARGPWDDPGLLRADPRLDLDTLHADLLEAEWADRRAAQLEYGRLRAVDSWLSVGRWVLFAGAAVGVWAAYVLHRRAILAQWGTPERYSRARKEHRRLAGAVADVEPR